MGRTVCAELDRLLARFLERRAHVCRDEISVLDLDEAVPLENLYVLSIQESACDSASPEVDVLLSLLGHGTLDRDVRDLNATSRDEHAKDLREDCVLVGDEVDHAVGDDDIEGVVIEGVEMGSPAQGAGLRKGDVILEVNRQRIKDESDYRNAMEKTKPEQGALFLVSREGSTFFISLMEEK